MKIINATSPEAVAFLEGKLQLMDDVDPDLEMQHLSSILEKNREGVAAGEESKILLLMIFDGNDLQAFCLATMPDGRDHAFLQQAWSEPGLDPTIGSRIFRRLIAWTHDAGRVYIRAETQRGSAIMRKWKFEEHSVIVRFTIPDDYEDRLVEWLDQPLMEPNNEQRRKPEQRHTTERTADPDRPGDQELPAGAGPLGRD